MALALALLHNSRQENIRGIVASQHRGNRGIDFCHLTLFWHTIPVPVTRVLEYIANRSRYCARVLRVHVYRRTGHVVYCNIEYRNINNTSNVSLSALLKYHMRFEPVEECGRVHVYRYRYGISVHVYCNTYCTHVYVYSRIAISIWPYRYGILTIWTIECYCTRYCNIKVSIWYTVPDRVFSLVAK